MIMVPVAPIVGTIGMASMSNAKMTAAAIILKNLLFITYHLR